MDLALVFARLVGLGLMAHGAQKLTTLFGGRGLRATSEWMESRSFRPGWLYAVLAGASLELAGGLIVVGFGGPIGPACGLAAMIVAALTVSARYGFFAQDKGCETPLVYGMVCLLLAFAGYGTFSVDAILKISHVWTSEAIGVAMGSGVLIALAVAAHQAISSRRNRRQSQRRPAGSPQASHVHSELR